MSIVPGASVLIRWPPVFRPKATIVLRLTKGVPLASELMLIFGKNRKRMQQLFTSPFFGFCLALVLSSSGLLAQNEQALAPCGTVGGRSPWLKNYQSKPQTFHKGGETTLYVALTVHLVGNDEGSGYYSLANLLPSLCKLNSLYEPAHIQFFIEGDLNYLDNSSYYNHETVYDGAEMMFANNRPNTLNVYFVQNPAGNCGYNLPYAGIANSISCSGPNDVTWAHEVGHALSLPHPFLGWEGGVSWDGSVDHNFSDSAPERVTYNYTSFQQTYFPPDTLIIDTAYVEKVDGSNCSFAADGFCDTPPDYLANRWTCNGSGTSSALQTDPNGERFNSEGSLVMNYANDVCQNRFSNEQIAAMRAFLLDQRSSWLRESGFDPPITETVEATGPLNGVSPPANATVLSWTPATHATSYLVQVSRLSSFGAAATNSYVTSDTSLLLPELLVNRTYYWRVRPFNNSDGCTDFTERRSFLTSDFISNTGEEVAISRWQLIPQPARAGDDILLQLEAEQDWRGRLQIISGNGSLIRQQTINFHPGRQQLRLPTATLPPGLYVLRLQNSAGWMSRKFLIAD
jgi:hypothetical protein